MFWKKALVSWAMAVCAGGAAVFGAEEGGPAKAPFTVSPATTGITSPLRADGAPDYIAAINEKFGKGVTPENNAFAAVFDVLGSRPKDGMYFQDHLPTFLEMLGTKQTPEGQAVFETYSDYLMDQKVNEETATNMRSHFGDLEKYLWRAQEEPQAAAYLKAMDPLLDRAVTALDKPQWWIPLISRDGRSMLSAELPSLGKFQLLGQALGARATRRLGDGDFAGYLRDVQAVMRLGRDRERVPLFLAQITGLATEAVGNYAIAAAADSGKLNEAQCRAIEKMLDGLPRGTTLADEFKTSWERYQFLDIVALVATGKAEILFKDMGGETDDLQQLLGSIDREAVDWDAVFKQSNAMFDESLEVLRSETVAGVKSREAALDAKVIGWRHERQASKDMHKRRDEDQAAYSTRVGRALITIFLPATDHSRIVEMNGAMSQDITRTLLAAAEVKARTGQWPAKLEALAPAEIKELPRDIYSADGKGTEAVRYSLTANGPRIYSVGPNGRDDGGVLAAGKDDIALGGFSPRPLPALINPGMP